MSHQATTWVLERSEQEGRDFIVLFVIANHCHPDGTGAYPSMERIAAQARISERGARYAVEALEKSGELVVKREKGATPNLEWRSRNVYSIPGVIRDGFYRDRLPKPEAPVAAGNLDPAAKPAAKNDPPSGKASGNELPVNYPKELQERVESKEPSPSVKSSSSKSKPFFSSFSSRYYKLVGTTPRKTLKLITRLDELCNEYGEGPLLQALADWVPDHGGSKKLKGDDWAPLRFLEDDAETMLTVTPSSHTEDKEKKYAHGLEKQDKWKDVDKKFPRQNWKD